MTPEQRYLFDVTGYIHLPNALSAEELKNAQEAVERVVHTPKEEMPPGCAKGPDGGGCSNGFSFDKSLEALTMHPASWPIIKELTRGRPRLNRGSLVVNRYREDATIGRLHCAREDCGWQTRRYEVHDGHIFCNDFIVFVYFTDVFPGDGGIVVLPGSHKAEFERPGYHDHQHPDSRDQIFFVDPNDRDPELHPALANITPRAGDMLIMSELLTHGVLIWQPKDRDRRFLILRYKTQDWRDDRGNINPFPQEVLDRLSPETRELTEPAFYTHVKEIAKMDDITLTA